jgi:hypothetical protein
MPTTIEVLLFDLGEVLVEFSGVRDVAPLLRTEATESEILERWSSCPHTEAYCRGLLTREDFAERFVHDWGVDLPPERFLQAFRSWSRSLLPDDVQANVVAASRLGMRAFQVNGVEGIRERLISERLL